MLTPELAGALRTLPLSDTDGGRPVDDRQGALFDRLAMLGYALYDTETRSYSRSVAGAEALARFDLRLAAAHRSTLTRLIHDPGSVSQDPGATASLADLRSAGLVERQQDVIAPTIDGDLLGRRAALEFAALRANPTTPKIFRALDGGRITVDDAQQLLTERRRNRPLIDRLLDVLLERTA